MTYIPMQNTLMESKEIQEETVVQLKYLNRHLAEMTDLELKEEDVNDND